MTNQELKLLAQKYLSGTATQEEKQQLNEWYNQFEDELEVNTDTVPGETEVSLDQKLKARLHQWLGQQPRRKTTLFPRGLRLMPAAALVILLVSGGYLVFRHFQSSIGTDGPGLALEKEPFKKIPKKDRIDLAIAQEVALTRDPALGFVPRERLVEAFSTTSAKIASLRGKRAVTGINWAERGPNNVGGRSRVVHFDLTDAANGYRKVWAGGVGGGLWSTNDITAASPIWTKVNDFFDNLAITSFGQDPSNPMIMYVGTGEGWFNADAIEGLGVFKSTDGGASWNRLMSTANFVFVQDIVVNAGGQVFLTLRNRVAGQGVGIQKSSDGGTTWTQVLGAPVLGPSGRGADLELASNGDLYASLGFGTNGRIYRSDAATHGANIGNAGTWTEITPDPSTNAIPLVAATNAYSRIELASAPSAADTLYAIFQGSSSNDATHIKLYNATTNTWISRPIPTIIDQGSNSIFTRGQAWYDLIAAVDPNNARRLYIGGVDALRSDDAGATWTQMTTWSLFAATGFTAAQNVHADHHGITYAPGSSSRALWGTDGGIDYTANADIALPGKPTFVDKNTGYNVTQFYASANHPTNPDYFLAGAQDNGSQRFNTAGINNTTEVTGGDGAFCHIDQNEPNIQITSYVYNNYYVSTNGGTSFVSRSKNNSGGFINPTDYDDAANILYCGATAGNYFRWINPATNGASVNVPIAAFSGGSITHVSVSPLTVNRVYFGLNNGSIVRVDNAHGASPVATTIRPTGGGSVSSVAIHPANEDHMLVTYSNYGVVSVFETINASAATPVWTNVEGNLPDMPVRWAMFDPRHTDWALLATELGVWSTDDINGASTEWNPTNTGLANVRVDMLQYSPATRVISAATHGRGLFSAQIPEVSTADINFLTATASLLEQTTATTGCRNYRDYTYTMAIANAPSADATVTLSIAAGATATEGVDFDITTNGNFAAPSKTFVFADGATNPQTINIRVYDDAEVETAESFRIEYAISGSSDAQRGSGFQTLHINLDNDDLAPVPGGLPLTFTLGTYNGNIGNGSAFRSTKLKHRTQYLFTAAELSAAGVTPGSSFNSLTIRVAAKNSTQPYNGFTISMANTSNTTLGTGFAAGTFVQVYSANYTSVAGNNTFALSPAFIWDGTSNVAIQFCFDNGAATPDAANDLLEGTAAPLGTGVRGTCYSDYLSGAAAGCTLAAAFVSDSRITAGFTVTTAGKSIATASGSNKAEYVGNAGTYYFSATGSGNLLSTISNASSNMDCINASILEAGNTWQNFLLGQRSQKVFELIPAANSTASYTIGLYFTAAELAGKVPANLLIAKTTAATMAGATAANTVSATTSVTAFGDGYLFTASFTGFSKFFLIDNNVALPVDLLSFTGTLNTKGYADLEWTAANQQNFSHFEVERSYDGVQYTSVGKVEAVSNRGGTLEYRFTDPEMAHAVNFYRLKLVDIDDHFTYSAVVRITSNKPADFVKLQQNPVRDNITLMVSNTDKNNVSASLFSSNGQLIKKWEPGKVEGKLVLPLYSMANGIYNLRVTAGKKSATLKISKQ